MGDVAWLAEEPRTPHLATGSGLSDLSLIFAQP
jgi:hypothetical protein